MIFFKMLQNSMTQILIQFFMLKNFLEKYVVNELTKQVLSQ